MRALEIGVWSLLLLGCGDNLAAEQGEVDIAVSAVSADKCPSITSAIAAPTQTSVGGTVAVSATASDPDPGETVSFGWSPSASFANPSSAVTSYRCPAAGRQALTLTIADNHRPVPCTANVTLEVFCVSGKSAGP